MHYDRFKNMLLSLFENDKLHAAPMEWGFFNENFKDVSSVGYAVNLSPQTIEESARAGVDLLLTHHDSWNFIFGLKEKCDLMLKENEITHAFFHAPLDDAEFGTSSSLAKEIGLTVCEKIIIHNHIFFGGVKGSLTSEVSLGDFSSRLLAILGEQIRVFNNNRRVKNICVAAGAGHMTDYLKFAVEADCDTYVTGEYSLYSQQYAELKGLNLLIGSHTATEKFGIKSLAEKLSEKTGIKVISIPESNY